MSSSNGTTNGKSELALARAARAAIKLEPPGGSAHLETRRDKLDKEALRKWMETQAHPRRQKRQSVLFTLAYRTDKGGVGSITEFDVPKRMGELEREDAISEAVDTFDRAAEAWVRNSSKPQGFFVGGHIDTDPATNAHVTFPFNYSPPPEVRENFEGTEKADPSGALGQYQRTLDTLLRGMMADRQEEKAQRLAERDSDRRHIEELMRIRVEMHDKHETLANGAALRAVQVKKTELEMEVQHKLTMALLSWGLPMVAKVLGADEASVGGNVFAEFAKSLEPDQVIKLLAAFEGLTPEQEKLLEPIHAALFANLSKAKKDVVAAKMEEMEANGEIVVDVEPPDRPKEPEK